MSSASSPAPISNRPFTTDFTPALTAGTLLAKAQIRSAALRPFGEPTILEWWQRACQHAYDTHGAAGPVRLLRAAADTFPGEARLAEFLDERSRPDKRGNRGGNIRINLPDTVSVGDVLRILETAKAAAMETGADVELNLGSRGSSRFSLSITGDHTEDEIETIRAAIERALVTANHPGNVTVERHRFRDYFSDPLTLEGPDGRQFAVDRIPASTTAAELARGVMHQYADDVWPSRKGHKTPAVIDKVSPDGASSQRLDPRDTLHDAGVRPHDTLRISPERTAGAVDPLMREAALARVRIEVLAYAEAHPGFEVEANSLVAPTEYLLRFTARSFAPSNRDDQGPPVPIDRHEALVVLPADFPVQAPEAWWQTDIFHSNIHPKTGWVCLGALREHYRPAMNFGDLCQMLVDLAGYRNYVVDEGHNPAAARWACTPEGQAAIESIGGIPLLGRLVMDAVPEQSFRIRRMDDGN
jgi:hypothetical protein